jgi:hypothetical protein
MTVSLKHTFASAKPDSADVTLIQPSNWNQEHVLTAAAGKVLGRDTSGAGAVQELPISVTAAGNVTIPNNFAVTGTTGLTGNTTVTGTLGITGTTTATNLNATGTVGFTNALAVTSGGTGAATLTANNVLIGNGTSAVTSVAPSTAGNVLTSNGTSWASTPAATGAYTEYLNQSTDVTLVAANAGKIIIDPTVSIMVQLPDATTLTEGKTFEITNASDQNNLFVKSSDGTYQAFVAAGQTVNVTAENVSTAAGVWVADNPNYGFSSPASFGYTETYTNYFINSATAAISATKMIRINSSSGTGLTATIITKSGSTITKGSEQPLLNLGLNPSTISNGYITVVMSSATTGIIATMGNNDASSTNILLYTFSISGSDVVQITGQDSFAATQTANKNGVSITMLSATSAVIVYHVSADLYSRVLTLSSGLITAVGTQTVVAGLTEDAQFPQVVALSATLVVLGYFEQYASPNDFYVIAASISGTTITWGTSVLTRLTAASGATYSISRLSATEYIVSLATSNLIYSNYGSVSGTTITQGATDTYTGTTGVGSIMSYPISSTSALVVFYDNITATNKPAAFVLTKSGTALTRGTTYTLATNPAATTSNPSPFSLKGFVAFNVIQQPATDFYMDYATTLRVFAIPLSVSGTVVTPGTGILVTPENVSITAGTLPAICTLSKTRAIAFVYYNAASDGLASSRLYLLDTSGARPVVLATSSTISTAQVFCGGQLTATRALIAYATGSGVVSTIRTLDITGDVFTFNASITGTSFIGLRPAIRKISATKAMLFVINTSTSDERIYNIAISGTTLTESASYVNTGNNAAQTQTSRRILYNYGDVGYFFKVTSSIGYMLMFDVSGVSPTNAITSASSISSATLPQYTALAGGGVMIALGAYQSGVTSNLVNATVDGNIKSIGAISGDFAGAGITMPFSANSVMICGNNVGACGKVTFAPATAITSTNNTIPNQTRTFTSTLSMHEPIQDWVDGDYFAPNTNKILFMGVNRLNLNYEMYHVFDKGLAQ